MLSQQVISQIVKNAPKMTIYKYLDKATIVDNTNIQEEVISTNGIKRILETMGYTIIINSNKSLSTVVNNKAQPVIIDTKNGLKVSIDRKIVLEITFDSYSKFIDYITKQIQDIKEKDLKPFLTKVIKKL